MKKRTEAELQKELRKIARNRCADEHSDLSRPALALLVLKLMDERDLAFKKGDDVYCRMIK